MNTTLLLLRPIWADFLPQALLFRVLIKTLHIMNPLSNTLTKPEKRLYYVVIYLLFYEGHKAFFARDFGISKAILEAWMAEKAFEAEEVIDSMKTKMRAEIMKDLNIENPEQAAYEPPTVESIKREILIRLKERVSSEIDSHKLAGALKILHQFEKEEGEKKSSKKTTIYDDLMNGGK